MSSSQTSTSLLSAVGKILDERCDASSHRVVHEPKIKCEQKNRDDNHGRRRLHFLERRRGDFFHLRAHIAVTAFDPLRPGSIAVTKIAGCCKCIRHLLRLDSHHSTCPSCSQTLAGAEGFEPPSPVLETGSLTVELTPLFRVGRAPSPAFHYFTSLCGVCLRHRLQNFFSSNRSGFVLRFFVVE